MTSPASPPDLEALERLLAEATCRPWCVDDHIATKGDTPEQWHVYEQCEDDPPLATCFHGRAEADARLIAAAVNALPALIAAAREREALLRELAKAMGQNERYRRALSAAKADIGTVAITGSRAKAETARVRIDAALAPEQEAQHGE